MASLNIAKNLNPTLITRVIKLDYVSAKELAELPQNKKEQAYQLAQKMAEQYVWSSLHLNCLAQV